MVINKNHELIVGTGNNWKLGEIQCGIWKYNSSINTWEQKLQTDDAEVPIIDMASLSNGNILAGTTNGKVYLSTDDGESFQAVNSDAFPEEAYRVAITHKDNVYIMFMGEYGDFSILVKSTDNGLTYKKINVDNVFHTGLGYANRRIGFEINPKNVNELWASGSESIWKLEVDDITGLATATKNLRSQSICSQLFLCSSRCT